MDLSALVEFCSQQKNRYKLAVKMGTNAEGVCMVQLIRSHHIIHLLAIILERLTQQTRKRKKY